MYDHRASIISLYFYFVVVGIGVWANLDGGKQKITHN